MVVAAFNCGVGGHFFRCPLGHRFVITEVGLPFLKCPISYGGAMEISRCPECGEAIGGRSHQLLETNRLDTQMDRIAREGGAVPSPWRFEY